MTARLATLEAEEAADTGDDGVNGDDTTTGTTTEPCRWKVRRGFEYDAITGVPSEEYIEFNLISIDPRTIKEADYYTIKFELLNTDTTALAIAEIDEGILWFRLEPVDDDVWVDDDSDIYQVEGPYALWWDTEVRESKTDGTCRYIYTATEGFDMDIPADTAVKVELEFELAYI